jgi:ketosteroid isomerase-like protein
MYRLVQFRRVVIAGVAVSTVVLALTSCAQKVNASFDVAAQVAVLGELQAEVAYLKDRQQIHDTYLRYMRGFDRNDVELMRSAFWPDVQINYGKQSNTFDEFVVRHLNQHTATLKTWGHLLTNETVDLTGDVAHVETYVTRLSSSKKNGKSMIISGRYVDRVERRNGEWRIAVREFIPHFLTETNTALDAYTKDPGWSQAACGMGTWDKRDPSYQRPLDRRTNTDIGPACAE